MGIPFLEAVVVVSPNVFNFERSRAALRYEVFEVG